MIKHEIRWEYILVICIILGTLPCNAQSVIPMPKEMVMGEGSWDVSADTRINYSNDALTKTVSLFNNYLDGRFGVTLKKGSKGKNAIHLQIDKKMPLEAYSLVVDDKGVTIKEVKLEYFMEFRHCSSYLLIREMDAYSFRIL